MRRQASVQTAHLSLESIEHGVVRLRDGRYRGVLQVGSVNFGLLGPGQQEGLIAGYTGFLNGLGFPVQILARVTSVDMARYLEDLMVRTREHASGPLATLAADHLAYVRRLARDRALLERKFYVVVPTESGLGGRSGLWGLLNRRDPELGEEAARSQLAQRCDAVARGLARSGLAAHRLGTAELAELYYACWCPELSRVQRLRGRLSEYTGLAVTRAGGEGRKAWAS
ncbi:MAG: hypothetical protein M3P51_02225 [Chloroflexota bacterium]|nr:hypothetical protein [Chloroflexota bacterium]